MSNLTTYIKEVIIEKFMSYEYGRIEFTPGLNIITGPNGAGKSSILLAISLAMGQSHTERGRRLSDLIRRGEDAARVSIVLDNTPKDGKRPFPYIRSDDVIITRVLKRNGNYWFEINYRYASKLEVKRMLNMVGIDPDNLLIIMHQNMIESFGFIDPREKLLLFEDALGLKDYRDRILDTKAKLERIGGEEAELRTYLTDAEAALKEWRDLYNRWLEKKRLLERLDNLNAKLAWAKYYNVYRNIVKIEEEISRYKDEIRDLETNLMIIRRDIRSLESRFNKLYDDLIAFIDDLYVKALDNVRMEYRSILSSYLDEIKGNRLDYGRKRAEEAVTLYRMDYLNKLIKDKERDLRELESLLKSYEAEARLYGEAIEVEEPINEIQAEIREVKSLLKLYEDVDEKAEETYKYYLNLYESLKSKMEEILRNKESLEEELRERISRWRSELSSRISEVSKLFNEFLNGLGASGYIRVEDIDDIEKARLELYVGFGGLEPIKLDAYSQSGGERTTAAMSFLLALQRFIKSPFRAVDEFDVHMDERNREAILNYLVDTVSKEGGQYLVITPGRVFRYAPDVNIIIVQKVGEASMVSRVMDVES